MLKPIFERGCHMLSDRNHRMIPPVLCWWHAKTIQQIESDQRDLKLRRKHVDSLQTTAILCFHRDEGKGKLVKVSNRHKKQASLRLNFAFGFSSCTSNSRKGFQLNIPKHGTAGACRIHESSTLRCNTRMKWNLVTKHNTTKHFLSVSFLERYTFWVWHTLSVTLLN